MPPASRLRTVARVEGIPLLPGTLAELTAAHPEVTCCRVDGIWHGWLPAGGCCAGTEVHGADAAELLAKLIVVFGGQA